MIAGATVTCSKMFPDQKHGTWVAAITEKITGNRMYVCRDCLRASKVDDTVDVRFFEKVEG